MQMLADIAVLAERSRELESGSLPRDITMGPVKGQVEADVGQALHPIKYPEVMDRPLVIAEDRHWMYEAFEPSNIRGSVDEVEASPSIVQEIQVKQEGDAGQESRESSPLSDVSSLTDVSEVGRSIKKIPLIKLGKMSRRPGSGAATSSQKPNGRRSDGAEEGRSGPGGVVDRFGLPRASTALVSLDRLKQLAAVQRLMEVKGEEAMLKFLLEPISPLEGADG